MIFQYPPLNLQTHPPSISFFLLLKMLMLTPVPIKVIPLSSQGPQRVELISSTLYLQPSPLWRHIWSDLNLLKPLLFVYNTVHTHGHMHTHTHTRVSTEFLGATVPPTLLYLENSFTSPGVLTHTTEVYGVVWDGDALLGSQGVFKAVLVQAEEKWTFFKHY